MLYICRYVVQSTSFAYNWICGGKSKYEIQSLISGNNHTMPTNKEVWEAADNASICQ